jgi:hypothetical protein
VSPITSGKSIVSVIRLHVSKAPNTNGRLIHNTRAGTSLTVCTLKSTYLPRIRYQAINMPDSNSVMAVTVTN